MSIDPFVNIRAMRESLVRALTDRKYADRCVINNVRICVRRKKLELDSLNVEIQPKHFDTTFIAVFKDTANNCTKGKFKICLCFDRNFR